MSTNPCCQFSRLTFWGSKYNSIFIGVLLKWVCYYFKLKGFITIVINMCLIHCFFQMNYALKIIYHWCGWNSISIFWIYYINSSLLLLVFVLFCRRFFEKKMSKYLIKVTIIWLVTTFVQQWTHLLDKIYEERINNYLIHIQKEIVRHCLIYKYIWKITINVANITDLDWVVTNHKQRRIWNRPSAIETQKQKSSSQSILRFIMKYQKNISFSYWKKEPLI